MERQGSDISEISTEARPAVALWELKGLDFITEQWGATEDSKAGELLIRFSFLKVSHQILTAT